MLALHGLAGEHEAGERHGERRADDRHQNQRREDVGGHDSGIQEDRQHDHFHQAFGLQKDTKPQGEGLRRAEEAGGHRSCTDDAGPGDRRCDEKVFQECRRAGVRPGLLPVPATAAGLSTARPALLARAFGGGFIGGRPIKIRPASHFLICKSLDLIQRSMSDDVIPSTAGIIGEVDSMLSRTRAERTPIAGDGLWRAPAQPVPGILANRDRRAKPATR